jgi:hypothetical protein
MVKWIIPLIAGLAGGIILGIVFATILVLPNKVTSEGSTKEQITSNARNLPDVQSFLKTYPDAKEYTKTTGTIASTYFVAPSNASVQVCSDEFCSKILIRTPFVRVVSDLSAQGPEQLVVYCGVGKLNDDGTIEVTNERRPCSTENQTS